MMVDEAPAVVEFTLDDVMDCTMLALAESLGGMGYVEDHSRMFHVALREYAYSVIGKAVTTRILEGKS